MLLVRNYLKVPVVLLVVCFLFCAAILDDVEARDPWQQAFKKGNYDAVIELASPAAEQGDIGAQEYLGFVYYYGLGVSQDFASSKKWFETAAENGCRSCGYYTGLHYEYGLATEKNPEKAAEIYRNAIDGVIVTTRTSNSVSKFTWNIDAPYEEMAFLGSTSGLSGASGRHLTWETALVRDSAYRLGAMYMKGRGVEQDLRFGELLLEFAAITGPADIVETARIYGVGEASFYLGKYYRENDDKEKAKFYYRWAKRVLTGDANRAGNPESQFTLGRIYLNGYVVVKGKIVKRDPVTAAKWFTLAAMADPIPARRTSAANARDLALGMLDDEQKAEVDEEVKKWIKRKGSKRDTWQDRTSTN